MHGRLSPGTRVETIKPEVESSDWSPDAKKDRRWGVSGVVQKHSDSHGLCYEVEHADKTKAWYESRELVELEAFTYTPEEREEMLRKMRSVSDRFYSMAVQAGCHALIEYTGLMNEFIKVCADAHAIGQQFPFSNTHSGTALPFQPYHLAYLAEKLNCIYGPTLLSSEAGRNEFIRGLFDGEYKLVRVIPKTEAPEDFSDLHPGR
jgi:hypothetical protein